MIPGAGGQGGPPATDEIPGWSSYRRLVPFLRPYYRPLALVLVLSLLSTSLNLMQPYLSKLMIDKALLRGDMQALIQIAGAMILVSLGGFALNMLSSYRYVSASADMLFDIRASLLRHLQRLSPRFYARFRLGDLMSRINSDVSDIQRVTADSLLSVLSNVLMLVGCVVMMLWLDPVMFVIGVVVIPLCIALFVHYQRKLTALTRVMRERGADLGSLLVDTVMGMRTVTSLSAEPHEIGRFRKRNDAFVSAMLKMQLTSFTAGALPGTLLTASSSAIILYGGAQIFAGKMTIGTLVAFMTYQSRLFSPIQVLMGLVSGLASARVSLGRIFTLFDTRPDVTDSPDALPFDGLHEGLRFDNVTFRHDGRTILDAVDLFIPAGRFCAILGPSGTGKSSMADLMVRFLDPDEGRVEADGTDLRALRLDDLRRAIVLVDQAPHLFNDSLANNIAFAWPDASDQDIAEAARLAGLGPLIARLPEGLATRTGERGQALSAGERHRVALARALLRRPSVLLLDEPTAALDAETERLVAQGLRQALPSATIVVITHKPALAEIADMTITLNDGKVAVRKAEEVLGRTH
ncbi:ABC transporter ATP-binding protein [Novosphingobium mangrovi (ex Huang et al. 2023)]|uniref:ABC transporter ATP-binding protein/permease n=1 Tax=Novosphingobium mangrovi (ex Huang et al. 2023) TaxID=2976432 RepID=A0ABT2IA67_9SPHN|nr:ABC transporter ATP-binding protein [Novosphingobium mangrovi (ex Huang et al. 2023)]MCT2401458.1 ABC transporter ATP-binding protein/permease [Novosphingobium mangrovi (ex Huang et al. 2023)]